MDRKGLREAEIELQQLYEKIRQKDGMMKNVVGQQLQGKGLQRWPAAEQVSSGPGFGTDSASSRSFTLASSESGNEDTLPSMKEIEASLPTVEQHVSSMNMNARREDAQANMIQALPSMKSLSLPSVVVSSMIS
ncbi:hypothetical protein E4U39_005308 [Claviceps sp. Clav50 group G5]|nr:hypothetical protein E4U39_005308 [Claviceps sp. Clav50 group G5]